MPTLFLFGRVGERDVFGVVLIQNNNSGIFMIKEPQEEEEGGHQELIDQFIEVVKQEQLNPDILAFRRELFQSLREEVENQRKNLKEYLSHEDENEPKLNTKNFRYMIYNAQIDKVEYLLRNYLRIRLKKIQNYCFHLIKNQQQAEVTLSLAELKFLKKYAEMRYQYFKDNIFRHLVRNYRDFKGIQVLFAKNEEESRERKAFVETKQSSIELKAPDYNQYVFAELLANPRQLRFGIDFPVSNMNSEQIEVVPQGTIIYGPLKAVQERMAPDQYRLI